MAHHDAALAPASEAGARSPLAAPMSAKTAPAAVIWIADVSTALDGRSARCDALLAIDQNSVASNSNTTPAPGRRTDPPPAPVRIATPATPSAMPSTWAGEAGAVRGRAETESVTHTGG